MVYLDTRDKTGLVKVVSKNQKWSRKNTKWLPKMLKSKTTKNGQKCGKNGH